MLAKLENENIALSVRSKGAEMCSLRSKSANIEYLWQRNKRYWKWQAPVCFPIVGSLADGHYKFQHAHYPLPIHGFARDKEFTKIVEKSGQLIYRLRYDAETLAVYPFKFQFDIGYYLKDTGIKIEYKVYNLDATDLAFSVGGHPGFNCPLASGEKFEDYELVFEHEEFVERQFVDKGLRAGRRELLLAGQRVLPLSTQLFNQGVIILTNLKSKAVSLRSRKSDRSISIHFEGFPYLGIWSASGGAPFVCIEPWCGITDNAGPSRDIFQKEGVRRLAPHEVFCCAFFLDLNA
jgi:galactose mutarotase-like enzyme